jgi:hypothetical protein
MKSLTRIVATAALIGAGLSAVPAFADGNVKCQGGPQDKWQPVAKLKKKAWLEGWKIAQTQVEGDCYEVYAHTAEGQAVEAFFHPVTLKKLVVFRRGSEIYRAPGFTG